MLRSHWKGMISFGLVSIPIVLYPVEKKEAQISFHQIDKRDNSRIKYQRINSSTGKVVPWEQVTRAYEYDEDTNIPVPDEVLQRVAGDKARTIAIESFIHQDELNNLNIINSYYLAPGKGGDKGYVILREALKSTKEIGIAKVIISTKEYLAALIPQGDALVLCLLRYVDEIRDISSIDLPKKKLNDYRINKKEMEMANKLIKSMTTKWHPEKFKNDYQEAIHQWVVETVKDLPHTAAKKKRLTHAGRVVNFVDLLRKSLAENHKTHKRVAHRTTKQAHHRHAIHH